MFNRSVIVKSYGKVYQALFRVTEHMEAFDHVHLDLDAMLPDEQRIQSGDSRILNEPVMAWDTLSPAVLVPKKDWSDCPVEEITNWLESKREAGNEADAYFIDAILNDLNP